MGLGLRLGQHLQYPFGHVGGKTGYKHKAKQIAWE